MTVRRSAGYLLALLPGALILYLSFNSGGYFPSAASLAALVLALVILVRIAAADAPFAGLGPPVVVAAGALMLYAAWTLLSGIWSHSSARALTEFNRDLLYVFAVLLLGTLPRSPDNVRRVAWGIAAAIVVVSLAGFLSRALPDVFEISARAQNERLGYPIGYWNALGLVAALGCVLCVHMTCSPRDPRIVRVLAAAALPLLATTLLFTFSRGPLAAAVLGLVAYLVLGRPRLFLSGLVAAGPATALALVAAYGADLLASKQPTTAAAAAQGHDVALVVAICAAAAALTRGLLLPLDVRLVRLRPGPRAKRVAVGALAVVAAAGVVALATGADAVDRVEAQYKRFTRSEVGQTGDYRDRLTDPGINRLDHWDISLNNFEASPLHGRGAGTFALMWDRERPNTSNSEEGHSLYLETLAELGVVGMVLLGVAVLALLAGVAVRVRGPERELHAAVLAVALAWVLHAGIDWDWEIPAVTLVALWLLAAAAGAPQPRDMSVRPARLPARLAAGFGCIALAATPALMAVSQARLTESITAFSANDCRTAVDKAAASLDALGNRPEPYEVVGYCNARSTRQRAGVGAMKAAVERDPDNWEYRYGLAVTRAMAGEDPRAAARAAVRRNPREDQAREAVALFRRGGRAAWRREARRLGLAQP